MGLNIFFTSVTDAVARAHNPLSFNFLGQLPALLCKIGHIIQDAKIEAALSHSQNSSVSAILSAISRLMAVSTFTILIADTFRPILMDLCARWLDDDLIDEVDKLVALCSLVEPYEEVFP